MSKLGNVKFILIIDSIKESDKQKENAILNSDSKKEND